VAPIRPQPDNHQGMSKDRYNIKFNISALRLKTIAENTPLLKRATRPPHPSYKTVNIKPVKVGE